MTQKTINDISKELEAVQMGEDEDDYFEKILAEESSNAEDENEDGTDATENKDREDKSEDNLKEDAKLSYEELESKLKESTSKIEELEKAAKGRLNDTVKSRQEKAQMKSELVELKSAVSKLLEQRDNALKGDEESEEDTVVDLSKKGIQFDDDDRAFVDLSDVDKKIASEVGKTREELAELKEARAKEEALKVFNDNINNIIDEDSDVFKPAYDDLKVAFKDLNDAVIQIQERLEIWDEKGAIDQDQALDLLADSDELKEWNKSHPGIDPIRIARAFNSKVDLRSSLRDIANAKGYKNKDKDIEADIDEKIKNAKDKPGSLGDASDQAGSEADLLTRISNLDSEALLGISDAEAAKIEAMLKQEELKGE